MNKLKLIALFLVLGAGVASAQSVNKPVKGDRLFELSATGINNLSTGLNTTRGGVMLRDFTADNKARRMAANINLVLDTDSGGDRRFNEISLAYGIENHMKGSKRMSTYWGYAGGLNMQSFDNISLAGGLFTGFDFYIADGLYLGSEVGYNALISVREADKSTFVFSLPGARMNGVEWLARHRPELLAAEFALNEGGGGMTDRTGKLVSQSIVIGEKANRNFDLEAFSSGGHSSTPTDD
ncbi:MAG: hypothetical protein RL025_1055, partial [Bacteroidota bacterium]